MRIVIIGAGFGGIAAAIRLQAHGHAVTLIDKRDKPGGRAYVYEQDGFMFDGGPTVITAPWLITELFDLAGAKATDYIDLVRVDPFYRIFFPDKTHFNYTGDSQQMADEIARFSPSDVDGYGRFVDLTKSIFEKGFTELADKPFLSMLDMLKVAPDLIKLQSYKTVYQLVSSYVDDERVRQVLSFHPLLVGGNPFTTTSIYALIHYLEREWGVWYARGGTATIVNGLVQIFKNMGGVVKLSAEADEIGVTNGLATNVTLRDGSVLPADAVVSNGDVAHTYSQLLRHASRHTNSDAHIRRRRYGMSLVVIYFGTNRLYRDQGLGHHNIILGPRYEALLHDIFSRKALADDFSLYLHMPTLTDPTLAPAGCESFYVLAPVPVITDGGTDWRLEAKPYRDRIMAFLERNYLPDLSQHLVTERMIDPRHFRDTLNSYRGNAFSVEPLLTQSAYFRPHNRSEDIANLYLVGAGTHPGAGVPGVLSSAKIVEHLIGSA